MAMGPFERERERVARCMRYKQPSWLLVIQLILSACYGCFPRPQLRLRQRGVTSAIDRRRRPWSEVPHDGEAAEDAALHPAPVRVDAPLLARPQPVRLTDRGLANATPPRSSDGSSLGR